MFLDQEYQKLKLFNNYKMFLQVVFLLFIWQVVLYYKFLYFDEIFKLNLLV